MELLFDYLGFSITVVVFMASQIVYLLFNGTMHLPAKLSNNIHNELMYCILIYPFDV